MTSTGSPVRPIAATPSNTLFQPAYTTVPTVQPMTSTSRYVQTTFIRTDTSYFTTRDPLTLGNTDLSGTDVIVIQPGSRYVRMAVASDAFPKTFPNVIARLNQDPTAAASLCGYEDEFELSSDELQERLAVRYKQAKKKPPPNIYQSLCTFNKNATAQEISSHNDAFGSEWTDVSKKPKYLVGTKAYHINPIEPYALFWPLRRGQFNTRDYTSYNALVGDLERIWVTLVVEELGIARSEFKNFNVMLVIPDSFVRYEIKACMEMLLNSAGFRAVSVIQEAVATSYGAGVSSACVVDCGAQKTSVVCVEDGSIITETKIKLDYGGDELTYLFDRMLAHHCFPFETNVFQYPLDFELVNDLKERLCTLKEDDLASMVYEFFVRRPEAVTLLYPFKIFEERAIVPLALFEEHAELLARHERNMRMPAKSYPIPMDAEDYYAGEDLSTMQSDAADDPAIATTATSTSMAVDVADEKSPELACRLGGCQETFSDLKQFSEHWKSKHGNSADCEWIFDNGTRCRKQFGDLMGASYHAVNHVTGIIPQSAQATSAQPAQPTSTASQQKSLAIDDAIIEALRPLDTERRRKFLSSFLLVGGGHLFPWFSATLLGRVSAKTAVSYGISETDLILNARDLDSRLVAWKGAAVAAKLECTLETWISGKEYREIGIRALKERVNFLW